MLQPGAFTSFSVPTDESSGQCPNHVPQLPASFPEFHCALPDFVPLSVTGWLQLRFSAWWDDHQRALRPDQDPAATRCGFLLLAIIDGNAAAVCAAVCCAHQTRPMGDMGLTDAKAHVFIIMQILLDHAICMDERKLLSI